jgi:hypothetical protein
MNFYLIEFRYDHYCQGYESASTYELVNADSFISACEILKRRFKNARDFQNHTISPFGTLW